QSTSIASAISISAIRSRSCVSSAMSASAAASPTRARRTRQTFGAEFRLSRASRKRRLLWRRFVFRGLLALLVGGFLGRCRFGRFILGLRCSRGLLLGPLLGRSLLLLLGALRRGLRRTALRLGLLRGALLLLLLRRTLLGRALLGGVARRRPPCRLRLAGAHRGFAWARGLLRGGRDPRTRELGRHDRMHHRRGRQADGVGRRVR